MDRRQWFKRVVGSITDSAAQVVEEEIKTRFPPQRRPPGAASEPQFLALCTRCGKCIEACPHGAVYRFLEAAGPVLADTPVMVPDQRPCHMCDDYPCIRACEPQALQAPKAAPKLGTVRVDDSRCITFKGPECGACSGLCPAGVAALRLVRCRPQIDASACVGCGLCIAACVMSPSAIEIIPLEDA